MESGLLCVEIALAQAASRDEFEIPWQPSKPGPAPNSKRLQVKRRKLKKSCGERNEAERWVMTVGGSERRQLDGAEERSAEASGPFEQHTRSDDGEAEAADFNFLCLPLMRAALLLLLLLLVRLLLNG